MQNPYDMMVFAKVVELQSFSKAADWLSISRSATSKHVSSLEQALAVRLLSRSTRKLKLTEAGQIAYPYCAKIIKESQAGEFAIQRAVARPKGLLRVSAPSAFGRRHIAPILPDYLSDNPEVSIELVLSDRLVNLVDEMFDVAIQSSRLTHANLIQRELFSIDWVVCASVDHLEANGYPKTPTDLAHCNCIFYASSVVTGDIWELSRKSETKRVQVTGNFRANNSEAICEAALRGLGIALLPTFIAAEHIVSGALMPLFPDWTPSGTFGNSLTAYFIADRHLTPKIRTLIDFLIERFKRVPQWNRVPLVSHRLRTRSRRQAKPQSSTVHARKDNG